MFTNLWLHVIYSAMDLSFWLLSLWSLLSILCVSEEPKRSLGTKSQSGLITETNNLIPCLRNASSGQTCILMLILKTNQIP